MKALQIILIALTSFSGCTKQAVNQPVFKDTTITKPMTHDTISYLALGDSYTIGEAVPQAQSYPYQLTGSLNVLAYNTKPPRIIAVTGWTTDQLINAINASGLIGKKYDLVTLL